MSDTERKKMGFSKGMHYSMKQETEPPVKNDILNRKGYRSGIVSVRCGGASSCTSCSLLPDANESGRSILPRIQFTSHPGFRFYHPGITFENEIFILLPFES
jgi:hypothetical protein